MGELFDAPGMAAAEEIRGQEGVDAGLGHFEADQARAQGDRVAVVMLPGERCRKRLGDLGAAAGGVAVGGDGDADARTADADPAFGPAVCQRFGEQRSVTRVIDAFMAVGAEVEQLVTLLGEPGRQLVLEVDAGMVGGEDYAHGAFLASKRPRRHPGGLRSAAAKLGSLDEGNPMFRKTILMAAAAGAALLAAPAEARWVEAKTQHFVIYANLSDGEAAAYAAQLERFDHLLRELTNLPPTTESASDSVTVYIVPLTMVQELAHSSTIGGFYNSDVQSSLAVMPLTVPTGWDVGPFHVMFHEYTHHILLSSTEASYPSWVQEGLAEFFGTVRFRSDGNLLLGQPAQWRGWSLHQQVQMTLEELLVSDGKKLDDRDMEGKYARGWLLTHYLLLGKKRPGQLDKYLKLVAAGVPSLEAGRQAFGELSKLDGEINVYNRNGKFVTYVIPANYPIGAPRIRPLGACEAAIMPTRIRSAVGVTEKTAPKLVPGARAAAKNCAGDSFVQRALAEVEFDAKHNAESLAAAERSLAADPGNVMAMVYKGRVLARQAHWDEARSWFIKANHAEPNYALPLVLYYDTYMRAGAAPTKPAVNALMRAIVLSPQDSRLRMRVAYQLIGEGDLALARKVLGPVAFAVHGTGDNKALEILKQIDAKAAPAAVLAQAKAAKWDELGKE